jgi:hypothetical protein
MVFGLCKELSKSDPDINACFLTASEQYYENFRNEEHHALDKELFLCKPISVKSLLEEINKRINSSSAILASNNGDDFCFFVVVIATIVI